MRADGLRPRLEEYANLGARFAKWRAVITIEEGLLTDACVRANAHAPPRYAAMCQEAGIAPIVEPEVLMDADNTLEVLGGHDADAARDVLRALRLRRRPPGHAAQAEHGHLGQGLPGAGLLRADREATVDCFLGVVPAAVPGIVFLSGGQSEVEATENLNAINRIGGPWPLSFSYGRALQHPRSRRGRARRRTPRLRKAAFAHRARMNSLATSGEWNAELEQPVTA